MNIKHFVLLLLISSMLSGCNKQIPTASCSSPDTQKLIGTLLTEQAKKLTVAKRDDQYDGSTVFGAVKVNTLLAAIQVAVTNVKTIKEGPNSRQSLCSGLLQVTVPPAMLADVDFVRDVQHQPKIAQYAKQMNIENSNNVFSQKVEYKVEYTVQPTGDGKELHVKFETDAGVHLLDEIVTAALLKPTLEGQETDGIQHIGQPTQEDEPVKPEADKDKSEAEKLRVMQNKQGLDKLNQELLEEEQVQKTLSPVPKEHVSQQVTVQSLPPASTTKPTAPSFDCSKAKKPTDITVCANSELVALDLKNMKRYKNAKSIDATTTKEIFKASIKSKYACGTEVDCIKKVYQKSILNYGCVAAGKDLDCGADADSQESESEGVTQ
ncbi:MAG: hypothetical protein WC856_24310 [Methylococcaceae bacterium]|jgi:hypothetical protein